MPTEQRRPLAPFHLPLDPESSFFPDELRLRPDRQVGVRKQACFPQNCVPENKSVAFSPLEMLKPTGAKVVDLLDDLRPQKLMDQETSFVEDKLLDRTRPFVLSPSCWRYDQDPTLQHDSLTKALALPFEGRRGYLDGNQKEKELFSSSLPDIFDKKISLTPNSAIRGQLAEKDNFNQVDDEPFELTKEIEAQTIGNLLPDDDDLLSGVADGVGHTTQTNNQDDIDDIFFTGDGIELKCSDHSKISEVNGGVNNGHTTSHGHFSDELKYGGLPLRTLVVRNVDSNIDDYELKLILERYGDIYTLYTDNKHHGFVMVSYYDVRSAENTFKGLQGKTLGCRNLDIYYSDPKGCTLEKDSNLGTLQVSNLHHSVTSDYLHQIFGSYGEIKEITEKGHHRFIVFYDVRAAEAARLALNRSDILEKRTKMERSCSGGTNRAMQQIHHELEQKKIDACRLGSYPSTCYGFVNTALITSTGPENASVQNLSSKVLPPSYQLRDGRFLDVPSTATKTISSPVGITSAAGMQSNRSTHFEFSNSPGIMNEHTNGHTNYCFQDICKFPHSLFESQNGLNKGIPFKLSTITPCGTGESMVSRHIYNGVSRNINTDSDHTNAFGFSRVASCPLNNHQLARNYSYNLHHQPSSHMLWPRTAPFINNNLPSRPLAQVHGVSAAVAHVPESILAMNHHQVGSAPAVHQPNWDRRHGYPGEMIEAQGFHPGSVASMGFPGSPHLHDLEPNSMFSQNGTFMEPLSHAHAGTPSPRQRGHIFHGRSRMTPHPSSFDSSGERMRGRRNESSANQSDDRRQFELDIQRIARGEDTRTTLMIKNIPNKYTSKMLLAAIDESHRGIYDFLYLPIDFKNKCNVGYAFINIISPEKIIPFYETINGKRWEKFNSEKVASLAYARIQGKSALIAHFKNSSLMNEDKRCRPILFRSDGPNAGDQEPFPVGTNIRTRPGRAKILNLEENGAPPKRDGGTPGNIARDTGPTMVA